MLFLYDGCCCFNVCSFCLKQTLLWFLLYADDTVNSFFPQGISLGSASLQGAKIAFFCRNIVTTTEILKEWKENIADTLYCQQYSLICTFVRLGTTGGRDGLAQVTGLLRPNIVQLETHQVSVEAGSHPHLYRPCFIGAQLWSLAAVLQSHYCHATFRCVI